jgi:hypothetical protein
MLAGASCTSQPRASSGRPLLRARPTATAHAIAYRLYTHCGIDEARVGGAYYEAVVPLGKDGIPPAGWGDPYQDGTMHVDPGNEAVFTDLDGHRVVFRLRPGARRFKHLCA